jgi:uncharacterized protein (TIGR00730 family)
MQRLCVFCGSSPGLRPAYTEAARGLGTTLAGLGITVVFGGGSVGLMGSLADATLAAGGNVIGVIPRGLVERELGHLALTELRVVESMHERKAVMSELSDGFIVLPGGAGTMEEFFEVWSWAQLGIHRKPCGILNVEGYYDPLLTLLDWMVSEGFLRSKHRAMILVEHEPETLLRSLSAYEAPPTTEWISGREA